MLNFKIEGIAKHKIELLFTGTVTITPAKFDKITNEDIAETIWPNPGPDGDPVTSFTNALKKAKKWCRPDQYARLLQMSA